MPKNAYDSNYLKPFAEVGKLLIAIGLPVLGLFKILIFFSTLLGEKLISITQKTSKFLVETAKTKTPHFEKRPLVIKKPEVTLPPLPTVTLNLTSHLTPIKTWLAIRQENFLDIVSALKISLIRYKGAVAEKITLKKPTLNFPMVPKPTLKLPHISKPNLPNFVLPKFDLTPLLTKFENLTARISLGRFEFKVKPAKRIRLSKRSLETKKPEFTLPKFNLPNFNFPKLNFSFSKFTLPKTPKVVGALIASTSGVIVIFLLGYFAIFVFGNLPNPKLLAQRPLPLTTKIYDRSGVLLYQFHGNENRTLVKLNELPSYVPEAVIAAEDKNFYKHIGFDPAGITRAALANYQGVGSQGGSTITQQLVKFSLLSPERTLTRKLRELVLSLWTERLYTKDEILTMYLNYIGFGGPAYGIEAASEIYFGKSAKDLSLPEAALLASLPSSPTTYSPFGDHPEIAKYRQMQILDKMAEQGYITRNEAEIAKKTQLSFVPNETEIKAPHFVMYVKDQLVEEYGERAVLEGGLKVTTTLDYALYKQVAETLKTGVATQKYLNVQNGAALVTNPKTGEILAMAGSVDFFDLTKDGNVNVAVAERSPGSSIKPLTYALAFDQGIISPNTVIDDSPTEFRQIGGPSYKPMNYDNRFHGKITARTALASSYNIPAVKILDRVGIFNFLQFATNAGLTTLSDPNRYGLAITLGGGETKMTDMAHAYSMFPNQGKSVPLKSILSVENSSGTKLAPTNQPEEKQLISPTTAFYINSILSDDGARAPTFGRGSILNIPGHTVAVKTGTAETKRDNWVNGYSFGSDPRYVSVWVGNNDNSPMSQALESGNTGAAAVWHPIMAMVLKDKQNDPVPQPNDLVAVQICQQTGTLTCENCQNTVTEYFVRGTEPTQRCNISKEDLEKLLNQSKNAN